MIRIREAAQKLVDKLELIHKHPAYESVWTLAAVHGHIYNGPKYNEELANLKEAIEDSVPQPVQKMDKERQ